jgi:hypothetical protein
MTLASDIAATEDPFYLSNVDAFTREEKLALALKLGYCFH